jgi:hypothetical protein
LFDDIFTGSNVRERILKTIDLKFEAKVALFAVVWGIEAERN